jgi:site-specific recombinase XerC
LSDFITKENKLRILGKGSKQREVFLSEDAASALESWLAQRSRRLGPLFTHASPKAVK